MTQQQDKGINPETGENSTVALVTQRLMQACDIQKRYLFNVRAESGHIYKDTAGGVSLKAFNTNPVDKSKSYEVSSVDGKTARVAIPAMVDTNQLLAIVGNRLADEAMATDTKRTVYALLELAAALTSESKNLTRMTSQQVAKQEGGSDSEIGKFLLSVNELASRSVALGGVSNILDALVGDASGVDRLTNNVNSFKEAGIPRAGEEIVLATQTLSTACSMIRYGEAYRNIDGITQLMQEQIGLAVGVEYSQEQQRIEGEDSPEVQEAVAAKNQAMNELDELDQLDDEVNTQNGQASS